MKVAFTLCFVLSCAAFAHAFVGVQLPGLHANKITTRANTWCQMAVEDAEVETKTAKKPAAKKEAAIVPINKENVEFSAGVVGGLAGFVVGGPVLAVIVAALTNYGAKQDGELSDAVRGVSKTAIEAFNFLTSLNVKYDLTDKTVEAVESAIDELKKSDDSKTIDKIQSTLKDATSKAQKLTSEYDLIAKGKQALGVVGELADTAIEKSVELEKEYKVTDKVKESAAKAVANLKDQVNK